MLVLVTALTSVEKREQTKAPLMYSMPYKLVSKSPYNLRSTYASLSVTSLRDLSARTTS